MYLELSRKRLKTLLDEFIEMPLPAKLRWVAEEMETYQHQWIRVASTTPPAPAAPDLPRSPQQGGQESTEA